MAIFHGFTFNKVSDYITNCFVNMKIRDFARCQKVTPSSRSFQDNYKSTKNVIMDSPGLCDVQAIFSENIFLCFKVFYCRNSILDISKSVHVNTATEKKLKPFSSEKNIYAVVLRRKLYVKTVLIKKQQTNL